MEDLSLSPILIQPQILFPIPIQFPNLILSPIQNRGKAEVEAKVNERLILKFFHACYSFSNHKS